MCFTFGSPPENQFPIAALLKDLPPRPRPGHRWASWHAQASPLDSCLGALLLPVILYKQMPLPTIAKYIKRLWLSYCKNATACKVSFERMVVGGVVQAVLILMPTPAGFRHLQEQGRRECGKGTAITGALQSRICISINLYNQYTIECIHDGYPSVGSGRAEATSCTCVLQ